MALAESASLPSAFAPAPLAGMRVLQMGREWGWYAGLMLRDLGADVVLLEGPEPHPGRSIPPILSRDVAGPAGAYHLSMNPGKRSVALSSTPAGNRLRADLLERSDAVI